MFACPIWGSTAEELPTNNRTVNVRSPRAGGDYGITLEAHEVVERLSPADRAKLTTWLVDERRFGNSRPIVTTDVLARLTERKPLPMSERVRRFFMLARERDFQPSSYFKISGPIDQHLLRDHGNIAAWTECRDDSDVGAFVRLLKDQGLLTGDTYKSMTAQGFERMEELDVGYEPTRQAFIAMWFDNSMIDAYENGFEPAIRDAGFVPLRIDKKEHGNKIDDEIVAEIKRSRFIVADFTCPLVEIEGSKQAVARGGVYYEAGLAHGLRMPVVWTCRNDCIDLVHFDTRQYNHIVWDNVSDLRKALTNRIRAIII